MTPLTDEIVIERLAKRMGVSDQWVLMKRGLYYRPNAKGYTSSVSEAWVVSSTEADKHVYPHDEPITKHPAPKPAYLKSLDALQPVLKTLTEVEWGNLTYLIYRDSSPVDRCKFILTLPPKTLAFKIAEVLEG
jgi:hypothetical protein